jgi:hypothetical protein
MAASQLNVPPLWFVGALQRLLAACRPPRPPALALPAATNCSRQSAASDARAERPGPLRQRRRRSRRGRSQPTGSTPGCCRGCRAGQHRSGRSPGSRPCPPSRVHDRDDHSRKPQRGQVERGSAVGADVGRVGGERPAGRRTTGVGDGHLVEGTRRHLCVTVEDDRAHHDDTWFLVERQHGPDDGLHHDLGQGTRSAVASHWLARIEMLTVASLLTRPVVSVAVNVNVSERQDRSPAPRRCTRRSPGAPFRSASRPVRVVDRERERATSTLVLVDVGAVVVEVDRDRLGDADAARLVSHTGAVGGAVTSMVSYALCGVAGRNRQVDRARNEIESLNQQTKVVPSDQNVSWHVDGECSVDQFDGARSQSLRIRSCVTGQGHLEVAEGTRCVVLTRVGDRGVPACTAAPVAITEAVPSTRPSTAVRAPRRLVDVLMMMDPLVR